MAHLPKSRSRFKSRASASATSAADTNKTPAPLPSAEPIPAAPHQNQFVHPAHAIPPPSYPTAETLIVVCCHAIFLPNADAPDLPLRSPYQEANWLLAPFQKSDAAAGKPGEHETFVSHIKAGIDALAMGVDAAHAPSSILVFSGGATKRAQSLKTEARSYYHAALAAELAEGDMGGGRAYRYVGSLVPLFAHKPCLPLPTGSITAVIYC